MASKVDGKNDIACVECGGVLKAKLGAHTLIDSLVGEITLEGFRYYECDTCGDVLYSAAMCLAIESERARRIKEG